jgi:predicted tellurium resistance membrane protein TerC
MQLLYDPQTWLSFLTLVVLEIVLGIDNIIFLSILVERLPRARQRSARLLGLGFAMLTRIALLFSITWLVTLTKPFFTVFGNELSGRDLVLFAGGLFLVVSSILEIRGMLRGKTRERPVGVMNSFWLIILQISLIDIVFSLDSVFTAVGLSRRIEVMVAAIVISVLVMMWISAVVNRFIDRFPTVKTLALSFLVLIGGALIAESLDLDIPKGYLYFAMVFAAAVEWINLRLRGRIKP